MRDVIFENLYYMDSNRVDAGAFDLAVTGEKRNFQNVIIKNAFIGNCKKLLNTEHEEKLIFDGLYADEIESRIEKASNAQVCINGKGLSSICPNWQTE